MVLLTVNSFIRSESEGIISQTIVIPRAFLYFVHEKWKLEPENKLANLSLQQVDLKWLRIRLQRGSGPKPMQYLRYHVDFIDEVKNSDLIRFFLIIIISQKRSGLNI